MHTFFIYITVLTLTNTTNIISSTCTSRSKKIIPILEQNFTLQVKMVNVHSKVLRSLYKSWNNDERKLFLYVCNSQRDTEKTYERWKIYIHIRIYARTLLTHSQHHGNELELIQYVENRANKFQQKHSTRFILLLAVLLAPLLLLLLLSKVNVEFRGG